MAEQLPDTQKADSSNLSYPTNGRDAMVALCTCNAVVFCSIQTSSTNYFFV